MLGVFGMKIENILSVKGLAFVMLFSAFVLAADSINFSRLIGSESQSLTLFQFIGPIAGGFLGAGAGVLSVFLAEIVSFAWLGKQFDLINVLRLAPMLFAALYFAKYAKGKFIQALVPIACMALFVMHPVGAQAWQYSLYWLIPAAVLLLPEHLLLRGFGSTFTAHAIGSVIWLYFMPAMAPAVWLALIPVVAFERSLFALGISGSYFALNTMMSKVDAVAKSGFVAIDRRYVAAPLKA